MSSVLWTYFFTYLHLLFVVTALLTYGTLPVVQSDCAVVVEHIVVELVDSDRGSYCDTRWIHRIDLLTHLLHHHQLPHCTGSLHIHSINQPPFSPEPHRTIALKALIFTARRVCIAHICRGKMSVCPSVCLSVTRRYCA